MYNGGSSDNVMQRHCNPVAKHQVQTADNFNGWLSGKAKSDITRTNTERFTVSLHITHESKK